MIKMAIWQLKISKTKWKQKGKGMAKIMTLQMNGEEITSSTRSALGIFFTVSGEKVLYLYNSPIKIRWEYNEPR